VIDARGRVISSTEPLEQTVLSETVSLIGEKTLYTLIGNIFTPTSFLVVVGYYVIQKKKFPFDSGVF
jgi:apolipoprotein N-acyltransferase